MAFTIALVHGAFGIVGILFWLHRTHSAGAAANSSPENSAMSRLGAGFTGGFFTGWADRKSIPVATMILAGLLALIGAAKWRGLIPLDWDMLTKSLHDAFAFFAGEAGKFEKFLAGFLPSGFAGAGGIFKGARPK